MAPKRRQEIAVYRKNDIILVVDYHDQNLVMTYFNTNTGEEHTTKCPTTDREIRRLVDEARIEAQPLGGRVIWIMESTTGWARVKDLLGDSAVMLMANVLQMPLPPKARRRKTDKIDTKRILREVLTGTLPLAFQPSRPLREVRRLVALRESLVSRRTALRNWTSRYLAHETWRPRTGLWSGKGQRDLRAFVASLTGLDAVTLAVKLDELDHLAALIMRVEGEILDIYEAWPQAQRVAEIRGIAVISAVSILARIGPVDRFAGAEQLISFAGLAPGVCQSDGSLRHGRIGGGGTDKHLRHYVIEATIWARQIPRYASTYERTCAKRGRKIARLVVGRLLLRSIYTMLHRDVRFDRLGRKGPLAEAS
jgi:transposase